MKKKQILGILGGTFDPVHKGHLHVVTSCLQKLDLAKLLIIPSRQSPQRPAPLASTRDRYAMLQLATRTLARVEISELAISRPSPSYAIDSLRVLRAQYPDTPLAFILGQDAFNDFNEWLHWQSIPTLAHLIVVNRPDIKPCHATWQQAFYQQHETKQRDDLHTQLAGKLYRLAIDPYPISATRIRQALREKQTHIPELDDAVHRYIVQHKLYD